MWHGNRELSVFLRLKHYGFAQGDIGKAMIVIAEMRSETRAAIGYDDDTLIATAKNAHDLTAEQLDTYISALEDDMITDEGRATYQQIKDGVASYQQIEHRYWNWEQLPILLSGCRHSRWQASRWIPCSSRSMQI